MKNSDLYRFLLVAGIVWGIILFAIFITGCSYVSRITFDSAGKTATLYSNTKTSAKINMKEQTAEINQIGETWLQKLQKSLPQNVDVKR